MLLNSKGIFMQHFQAGRFCSTSPGFLKYGKDPAPFFIDPKVQQLLKSVTGLEFAKIFGKRSVTENKVDIKFMTPEKLRKDVSAATYRARKLLQMPPIVKVLEEQQRILSKNALMEGFSDSKYVITDISFDVKNSQRTILVRHEDGTLEVAPNSIRKRMNQIFIPRKDRKIHEPKMFEPEFFDRILEERQYEFILDRACTQFEPYEQEYHDITAKVYQNINQAKKFHDLRSTRHFGTMTFFLAWHKMIDDLVLDCLHRGFLRNAVEIILLHHKLHAIPEETAIEKCLETNPDTRNVEEEYYEAMISGGSDQVHRKIDYNAAQLKAEAERDESFLQVVENYTKNHGIKKILLDSAVETHREEMQKKLGDARQESVS